MLKTNSLDYFRLITAFVVPSNILFSAQTTRRTGGGEKRSLFRFMTYKSVLHRFENVKANGLKTTLTVRMRKVSVGFPKSYSFDLLCSQHSFPTS